MKTKKTTFKLHTLIDDMSSAEYHSTPDTYSSSQFKDAVDDVEVFIKKYVRKEIERKESPAFDIGTYFHTGVLEPHKLKVDCAVYPGKTRTGKAWIDFKAKNEGKAIITPSQLTQAEGLVKAVKDSPIAMDFVDRAKPEVSLFTEILVVGGEIFAPHYSKRLEPNGWHDESPEEITKLRKHPRAVVFIVKVRADALGEDFILDLKSTGGSARDEKHMASMVTYWVYDLSAALYLDMFSLMYPKISTFYWTFASKEVFNCQTYAASDRNILIGRKKWSQALKNIAAAKRNNWSTPEMIRTLEPTYSELIHLQTQDTDLV